MRGAIRQTATAWSLILWLVLATAGRLLMPGSAPQSCGAPVHHCDCRPNVHATGRCCCAHDAHGTHGPARCLLSCGGTAAVGSLPAPLPPCRLCGRLSALLSPAPERVCLTSFARVPRLQAIPPPE